MALHDRLEIRSIRKIDPIDFWGIQEPIREYEPYPLEFGKQGVILDDFQPVIHIKFFKTSQG